MADSQQSSQDRANKEQKNLVFRMLENLWQFFRNLFSRKGQGGTGQAGSASNDASDHASQAVGAGSGERGQENTPGDPEMGQTPSEDPDSDITDAEWSEVPDTSPKSLGHEASADPHRQLVEAADKERGKPTIGLLGVDSYMSPDQVVSEGESLSKAYRYDLAEGVLGEHANAMKARIEPGVTSSNSKHSYDFDAPYQVNMDKIEERLRWVVRDPKQGIGPEDVKDAYFGALVMGKMQALRAGDSITLTENEYESQMRQYVDELEEKLENFEPFDASDPKSVASMYSTLVERIEGSYLNLADATGTSQEEAKANFRQRVMGEQSGQEAPARKTESPSM